MEPARCGTEDEIPQDNDVCLHPGLSLLTGCMEAFPKPFYCDQCWTNDHVILLSVWPPTLTQGDGEPKRVRLLCTWLICY